MTKYREYCNRFWDLFDRFSALQDKLDRDENVDAEELAKAKADIEKHKNGCPDCKLRTL